MSGLSYSQLTENIMKSLCLLALTSFGALAGLGDYYSEYDCVWRVNGCMRGGEYIIDLRSSAQKSIENIKTCREDNSCSSEDLDFLSALESPQSYLTASQYKAKIAQYSKDSKKQYFIPIGLTDAEKIGALATASIGLVVFANDQEILDVVQENKTDFTQQIEDFGYYAGADGVVHLAAGSYFMGVVLKNGKLKQVGMLTAATGIVSQTITEAFKVGFGRTRPRNSNGDPYIFGTDEKSFFSGHASAAFGTAAVLAEVYKGTAVPYVAYGVAGLVGYARMHAKGHYLSDVVFGALAGVLSAKLTMRLFDGDDSNGGLLVTPGMSQDPFTGETIYQMNFTWAGERPRKKLDCSEFDQLSKRDKTRLCIEKLFQEHYQD